MVSSTRFSLNLGGTLLDLSVPCVMGILNVTPDSFYPGCRAWSEAEIAARAHQIITQGARLIDIGAYSSRPGAEHLAQDEEMQRLRRGLTILFREYPQALVSVDTFRADVAKMCVEEFGVVMINDIAAGTMDERMFPTIARLQVPYILMHMQGTPQNMQLQPSYTHLMQEVFLFFAQRVEQLHALGVNDLVLDPGFGFGKTLEHNYQLLAHLQEFRLFELPLLVGLSRKSMIYGLLKSTPQEALNGTTVLHTVALQKGAHILRVHDVKEAVEAVRITQQIESYNE
ncbi:MAG: dihydropteroate synthase [Prevotellaceae bacterium]|jgi:dihydropteroate synthase|nr:dihydropteroate synthase [Prevotellaceae bacterium]